MLNTELIFHRFNTDRLKREVIFQSDKNDHKHNSTLATIWNISYTISFVWMHEWVSLKFAVWELGTEGEETIEYQKMEYILCELLHDVE